MFDERLCLLMFGIFDRFVLFCCMLANDQHNKGKNDLVSPNELS